MSILDLGNNLYLFDCFGVVVSDVSTLWMNKHFDKQQQAEICKDLFRKVDTGKITQQQVYEQLATRCNMPVDALEREWDSCLSVNWDTIELINKLRSKGATVALLSNAAVEYIDYIFDKFDLRKYFNKLFVSSQYGYAKPDIELYRIGVNSFDRKFGTIYFTDDNPNNLVNLQQLGITPLLFTSASELAKKLQI